jgi:integrase
MKWQKTKTAHLLKNSDSGRYYARLYRDGKEVWKSLKTEVYSVALARLADEQKTLRSAAKVTKTVESGEGTVEAVAGIYLKNEARRVDIKPATVKYRRRMVRSILKTWPELESLTPKQVTEADCEEWAARYSKEYSGTQFNNGLDTLFNVFDVAVKNGTIFRNPVNREEIGKRKPCQKKLELPSKEQFERIIKEVRTSGFPFASITADMIEFLAYSGCRIEEAVNVRWTDVQNERIWVHGDEETGTKGNESRRIPIIPPMADLLERIKTRPQYRRDRKEYVLQIQECLESLETACAKVGVKRLTHHDLRHLFATRAIESGVDIPTVSRFLGHKDGGVLAMRTYGHLRDDHAQAMAAKIRFWGLSVFCPAHEFSLTDHKM